MKVYQLCKMRNKRKWMGKELIFEEICIVNSERTEIKLLEKFEWNKTFRNNENKMFRIEKHRVQALPLHWKMVQRSLKQPKTTVDYLNKIQTLESGGKLQKDIWNHQSPWFLFLSLNFRYLKVYRPLGMGQYMEGAKAYVHNELRPVQS
jgi:hypothetical protein